MASLTYYLFLLRRHRRWIATFVLVVTVVVTLFTLALPKKYESSVLLRVDPQGKSVVGDSSPRSDVSVDAALLVQTEARVITSPAVVLSTIQALHLDQNPEFAPPDTAALSAPARIDRVLRAVTDRIGITQPIGTLLLQVSFRSRDPKLSADIANGLATSFLEQEYLTRSHALTDSTRSMAGQLDQMRAQMEMDQTALVNYESSHDVINPGDKSNIYESRLSQINSDLSASQSARMNLEADDESARSGNLDALLVTPRGARLLPLQERLLTDQRVLSHMATIYGPRHPLYLQQNAVVQHDEAVLRAQELHVAQQVKAQYKIAVAREHLIQAALEREKREMDAFNMRAIRYGALKAAADSSTKLYYDLQQRIQDATVAAGLRSEDLRIISAARPADKPVFPRPLLAAVLAFLGSSVLGIGATVLSGLMDKTVSSPQQAELRFGIKTISTLPLVPQKDGPSALSLTRYGSIQTSTVAESRSVPVRRSTFQEAVLSLHSAIQFAHPDPIKVLAITSSVPGEGKSTISCHLAAAFAGMNARTVIIDGDLRKPNVHRLFGCSNQFGLSSILRGKRTLESVLVSVSPGLSVLPAGPSVNSPTELLHLGLGEVIESLKNNFDLVLIDCPPTLGFADSSAVANLAEAVLLVVAAGTTEHQLVDASLRQLNSVRANLLGIILNRVSAQLDEYYTYYKDYYRQYYDHDPESTEIDEEDC